MRKISLTFYLFLSLALSFAQRDSMMVVVNDSTVFWHKIKWTKNDTINGSKTAVYLNDTTKIAFSENYVDGKREGASKKYYPTGRVMEKTTYSGGIKNGEYALHTISGDFLIRGKYKNGLKEGLWDDKRYRISGRYKAGKKEGVWRWFYNDFVMYEFHFKNGELQGKTPVEPPYFLFID